MIIVVQVGQERHGRAQAFERSCAGRAVDEGARGSRVHVDLAAVVEGVGEIPSGGTDDHVRHAVAVDVAPTSDGLTEALTGRLTVPGPDRAPVDHREHARGARAAAGAGASDDEIGDGVIVDVADRGHGPTVLVNEGGAFAVAQEGLRLD